MTNDGRRLLEDLLNDYPGEMRTWGETPDEKAVAEARAVLSAFDASELECARLRAECDALTRRLDPLVTALVRYRDAVHHCRTRDSRDPSQWGDGAREEMVASLRALVALCPPKAPSEPT